MRSGVCLARQANDRAILPAHLGPVAYLPTIDIGELVDAQTINGVLMIDDYGNGVTRNDELYRDHSICLSVGSLFGLDLSRSVGDIYSAVDEGRNARSRTTTGD